MLLKDNIATRDGEQTTAGSFALAGSRVPRDAALAPRLRDAGAVDLGKANLSDPAFTVLLFDFKVDAAHYRAGLRTDRLASTDQNGRR